MNNSNRRIRPKIHVLIHPGYPKTATTWLQTSVFPSLDNLIDSGKSEATLTDLDRAILAESNQIEDGWERMSDGHYRSTYLEMRRYISDLVDMIVHSRDLKSTDDLSPSTVVVVSNEKILLSGGVVNVGIIVLLLGLLKKNLSEFFDVSCHVVITIREQKSFIQSYYAYRYSFYRRKFRDVASFVDYGTSNPSAEIFGQLYYDDTYNRLFDILGSRSSIRFIPYEGLFHDAESLFLRNLFHFIDDSHPLIEEIMTTRIGRFGEAVNINSDDPKASERINYTRNESTISSSIMKRIQQLVKAQQESRTLETVVRPIRPALKKGTSLLVHSRIGQIHHHKSRIVKLSENDKSAIDQLYGPSNSRFAEISSIPLRELGYYCA